MESTNWGRGTFVVLLGGLAVFAEGCAKGPPPTPPPADVQVVNVEQDDIPVTQEWVGSLDGSVNAQIRAQVTGYLIKQDYKEGSPVKKGDVLFEIDPRPFEAAVAQAKGVVGQARAQLKKADQDVARYKPLAADKAISQEELDDAVQARLAAQAQMASALAALQSSELSASFTKISSPTDGVAGLIQAQIGDLVGPSTGVLTTVSNIDPIKAYFPISEQAYLEFRGRDPKAPSIPTDMVFNLTLSDGSTYPMKGSFYAIDSEVDANTGTIRVVAEFPNPHGLLRAGQYAKVRAVVRVEKGALVVPIQALSELQGGYQLATVDSDNHVHILTVKTGPQVGQKVVVESGLHPGDRVVVDGVQKIAKDGALVNPVPYASPTTN
jgi:RND family efflux transporter MFP subunit